MSDLKISQLNSLAGGSLASNDVFAVVDTSASETKKITSVELVQYGYGLISSGTLDGDVIEIGTTSVRGTLQLTDAIDSTSTTTAATPNSVKTAYDLANSALPISGGSVSGNLIIGGDLTVNGTTTTIDTTTLVVEDKNIEIGSVDTPSDTTANGGGITLKGTTDKTINWIDATDAWTSSERFDFPAGTAGAPSIILNGDVNSGIYQPGADQVAISTNGTGRLFIASDGKIGVGVASPGAKFEVIEGDNEWRFKSDTAYAEMRIRSANGKLARVLFGDQADGARGAIQYDNSDNSLQLRGYDNTERLRITSDGKLGLGTSSPGAILHTSQTSAGSSVIGAAIRNNSATASTGVSLDLSPSDNAPGVRSAQVEATNNGSNQIDLNFKVSNGDVPATRMTLDYLGRLGIGTTSPTSPLSVLGSSNTLFQGTSTTEYASRFYNAGRSFFRVQNGTSNGQFVWESSDGTLVSERMRIDSSGNVGIGTSSPGSYDSSARQLVIASSGASAGITIASSTTGAGNLAFADGTSGNEKYRGFIKYDHSTDSLEFATAASEKIRIDSSGRLLVGTSSSIGGTVSIAGSGLYLSANDSNAEMQLARASDNSGSPFYYFNKSRGTYTSPTVVSNADICGTINFRGHDGSAYIAGASISAVVDGTPGANDMPGRLVFSTTADGESSPTERMRIANGGELLAYSVYTLTTASAADVNIDSNGTLRRSTSSSKYKTGIESIEDNYSDALLNVRPVWYRSTCAADCPDHSYWGFIAEEVAEIDPRLVHWKTVEINYDENGSAVETPCDPEPEGVAYDRFVPHLLNLIKRQKEQIEAMEARLSVLEAQ